MSSEPSSYGILQPGHIIRPVMKLSDVPALLEKLFGLTPLSVKELNSYDDKNYHVQVKSTTHNDNITEICPNGYVLKILNSLDSKNEKLVNAQNQMMLFLHSRGFNIPKPERNIHGTHLILEKINSSPDQFVENNVSEEPSGLHIVRLLTFVEGKILHQVPYTPDLFYECGVYIAKLDNELKDFQNDDLKSRKLLWMLDNTPNLSKFLFAVRDEKRTKVIQEILEAWELNVLPLVPTLEKGIIHGDYNEQNILVASDPCHPATYHIHGLLDFGDIHHACYVFELAIAIMYTMVEVTCMPPNDVGGHIIAGYLTQRSIPEEEWSILKECVAARFAQSLVIGAYSYEQDPGNEYVIVTAAKGWDVLFNFWKTPKEEIINRWKEIVKSYKK